MEGLGLGIQPLTGRFQEFLKAPELEEPDPEEREMLFEAVECWIEYGWFVHCWGNDYCLDGQNEVALS